MQGRYELRAGYNFRDEPRWYIFDAETGLSVRQFASRIEANQALDAYRN